MTTYLAKVLGKSGFKYTAALTFSFLLITSIAANFALHNIETESRLQIRDTLQAVLKTTVTAYHTWVEYRIKESIDLAQNPYLVSQTLKLLEQNNNTQTLINLRQFLQPKLEINQDQGFFIINKERISIASMRDSNLNTINLIHKQRSHYLDKAFKGESLFVPTVISDVTLNNETNNHSLSAFILSPITKNNEVLAVLAIRINLSLFFTRVTDNIQLGDSGETYGFDQNGTMITNSRFDQQLRRTGLMSPTEQSIMNLRLSDPGGNLLKGFQAPLSRELQPLTLMAQQATQGKSGFNVQGYRDYRGIEVAGAWMWDDYLGFGIASEIDIDEALNPYYKTRNTMIIVLSLTLAMALMLLALVIKIQQAHKTKLKSAYNSLEQRVNERTQELSSAKQALEQANISLEKLAAIDSLTALANRRTFDDHLKKQWLNCRREKSSLGIIMIDIDYFKNYNDYYGHQKGDECLQKVANALINNHSIRRPGDLVARYGGEEFIVILSNPSKEYIQSTAQKLVSEIQLLNIAHDKTLLKEKNITISLGFVIANEVETIKPTDLIHQADQALYRAKSSGRNKACEFNELTIQKGNGSQIIQGSFGDKNN